MRAAHPRQHGFLLKTALREVYAYSARMEDVLRKSDLDWTAVWPVKLTDSLLTGTYRTAYEQNVRYGLFISRTDLANCMLRVLNDAETFRQTIGIAN